MFELANSTPPVLDDCSSSTPLSVRPRSFQSKHVLEGRGRRRIRLSDEIVIDPRSTTGARRFSEVWENPVSSGKTSTSKTDDTSPPPYGANTVNALVIGNKHVTSPDCSPVKRILDCGSSLPHTEDRRASETLVGNSGPGDSETGEINLDTPEVNQSSVRTTRKDYFDRSRACKGGESQLRSSSSEAAVFTATVDADTRVDGGDDCRDDCNATWNGMQRSTATLPLALDTSSSTFVGADTTWTDKIRRGVANERRSRIGAISFLCLLCGSVWLGRIDNGLDLLDAGSDDGERLPIQISRHLRMRE